MVKTLLRNNNAGLTTGVWRIQYPHGKEASAIKTPPVKYRFVLGTGKPCGHIYAVS
jgi:hypothetical protein